MGRPRRDGRPPLAKKDVFIATARLIAWNGYSGTSIRMIADAVNSPTASITHLFPSKSAILNELFAWSIAPSLAFFDALRALDLPPTVMLFKSVFEETTYIASFDRDIVSVLYLPELRRPEFEPARQERDKIIDHYRQLMVQGVTDGEFDIPSIPLAAEQVCQLTETPIVMSRDVTISNEEQATLTARTCLRTVLADAAQLPSIEAAARKVAVTHHPAE